MKSASGAVFTKLLRIIQPFHVFVTVTFAGMFQAHKKKIYPITASQIKIRFEKATTPSKSTINPEIMKSISKDQFVGLLTDSGIEESQMQQMHALFESRYPESHQAFLSWLGVDEGESREIRQWAKQFKN